MMRNEHRGEQGKTEHNKLIHIVVSIDNGFMYIITAYYPDKNEWEADMRTRKEDPT